MKIYRNIIAMAAAAAALTFAAQARAAVIDTTSFFLNQPECTGTCGPGSVPALIPNSALGSSGKITLRDIKLTVGARSGPDRRGRAGRRRRT